MDDANLETGAETATQEPLNEADDINQRLAELIGSEGAAEESTSEGVETDQPDADTPEPDEEPLYTVKVDGQEIQVKQSELLAGYQRDADYRNKTKAIAEQRQAVEAERQSVTQERNAALQVIERFQAELGQLLQPAVDWGRLAQEDPAEYIRQKHAYDMRMQQYNQAEQAKQYMLHQSQQEQQKHLQAHIQAEAQRLIDAIPEWKDEAKAKAGKEALNSFLKSYGYGDQEIGTVADHRMVVIADKARRYDELMKKAALTQKKVEKVPPRVERPGSSETNPTDGRTQAMQRLKRSGSVSDAAAVFANFI